MFFKAGNTLINLNSIQHIDITNLEDLSLTVDAAGYGAIDVHGVDAINLIMSVYPVALEGRRLKWVKFAWAVHNLIGHPLMQIAAFFKRYDVALKIHDATIPRPRGIKSPKNG